MAVPTEVSTPQSVPAAGARPPSFVLGRPGAVQPLVTVLPIVSPGAQSSMQPHDSA
jgi:hypothetical protein